jgi:putative ABC transport system permease protein
VAQAAALLPGATAAGIVSTDVFLLDRQLTNQGHSWDAAGLDPASTHGTLDLDVRAGSLAAVRDDGIAVSDAISKHGVQLGSVLNARLADATPARLRVVAIYRRSNGIGDVVLPRDLALAHAVAPLDTAVYVAGADDRAVARGLHAIVRSVPTAVIRSREAYLGDVKAQDQENARSQWVVVALMIGIAAMAAFNTGAMAATERRRELLLARLSGATGAQVIGAVTLESLLTTLAGIGVGVAVVLGSLAGVGGDPGGGALVIPWGQAGLVLGGAVALGLSGTLLPAAIAGRARLTALAGLRE